MKRIFAASTAMLLLIPSAQAATQGTLGPTSSGSYVVTANGPATPAQVQVLNVSDVTLTNSSRVSWDPSRPGVSMQFCLVQTQGGAVNLSVSSASGSDSQGWLLKTANNESVTYVADLYSVSPETRLGGSVGGSSNYLVNVAAGVAVTSSATCGAGNLRSDIRLVNQAGMPQTFPARTYTDTITIVASPQ